MSEESKVTSWEVKLQHHAINHAIIEEAFRIKRAVEWAGVPNMRLAEILVTYARQTDFDWPSGVRTWGIPTRFHFDIAMEPGTWKVQGIIELDSQKEGL